MKPVPTQAPSNDIVSGVESRGVYLWSNGTLLGVLILCAALPYVNTLFNAFVYDDNTQVLNNPYIQSFRHLRAIFSTTVWSYMGVLRGTNYYRPMMTLGYLICYQLFGPLAYGFHLTNVILHTAAVCILFLVTERMFKNRLMALVAAWLFAVHPVHAESVAWIAAVTDLEVTVFYLLTFWFFLGLAPPSGVWPGLGKLGMVGSYVLALLSKEQALTFPLLATVYEHFYREDRTRTAWAEKLSRYGTLWLMSLAYLLFRIRLIGAFAPVLQRPDLSWYEAFLSGAALAGQYIWKLLWPVHLCAFYVFRKSATPLDPRVIAGSGTLILCVVLFVILWRHARPASFGLVWFLATLAPVLNARWLAANAFTERYLYLPSAGFCWMAAWGCVGLWTFASRRGLAWRRSMVFAFGTLTVLCLFRIVTRNRDWHDDLVLYARTLAVQPEAWHIHNNLGVAYWMRGNLKGAEQEWREALKIKPENDIVLTNLGLLRFKEKRYDEAVKFLQHALQLDPRFTDAHLHLGETYLDMKLPELAETQFRATVALSPLNIQGRNRLGQLYLDSGRVAEAEEQFLRSVESEPNATGYDGLGDVYLSRNARQQAERAFARALAVDPFDSHAHFKLGALYAQARRNAEALQEYRAGLVIDPANPEALAAVRKLRSEAPNAKP